MASQVSGSWLGGLVTIDVDVVGGQLNTITYQNLSDRTVTFFADNGAKTFSRLVPPGTPLTVVDVNVSATRFAGAGIGVSFGRAGV